MASAQGFNRDEKMISKQHRPRKLYSMRLSHMTRSRAGLLGSSRFGAAASVGQIWGGALYRSSVPLFPTLAMRVVSPRCPQTMRWVDGPSSRNGPTARKPLSGAFASGPSEVAPQLHEQFYAVRIVPTQRT